MKMTSTDELIEKIRVSDMKINEIHNKQKSTLLGIIHCYDPKVAHELSVIIGIPISLE